ncbi:MAG: Fur family transcriptional regulator [Acidimicrobiales bacterium]
MRTPGELARSFRERGLRITPQRLAVFEALHTGAGHPTAEAVYQIVAPAMPSISLRTVYQTLNDLTELGEIRRLEMAAGAARFDTDPDEHHHLVCDECGAITDAHLDLSGLDLGVVEGFRPTKANVFVSGRCRHCAPADADES